MLISEKDIEECEVIKQNSSTKARFKKSTPFLYIRKSPTGAIFKGKFKGIIFPKSMKMPFWGFGNLAKKIANIFLITKCVDLNGRRVIIFFKLWMTMKNKMDNP